MEIGSYLSEKHRKKRNRRAYLNLIFVFAIVYALCAGSYWFILRSPFFRVNQIAIAGNSTVASSDIIALLQGSVLRSGDSMMNGNSGIKAHLGTRNMLVWPGSLPTNDLAVIPQLASINIAKDYFSHTVTARVAERQPFGIWCLMPDDSCYWFDDTGVIFQRTFDTEGSLLSSVHDYSQTALGLGGTILPAEFVGNMLSILNVIKESGISAKEIALNNIGLQEIDITTYNGPALYFSLRFPADEDLTVLQSLMVMPKFAKLQYVDFRVENRAYYK